MLNQKKEAYQKAIFQKDYQHVIFKEYTDNPYETFYKELKIPEKFFSISRKKCYTKRNFFRKKAWNIWNL